VGVELVDEVRPARYFLEEVVLLVHHLSFVQLLLKVLCAVV
jgi:hypothetical protein